MALMAQPDQGFVYRNADQPVGEATTSRELIEVGESLDIGPLHYLLDFGFRLEQRPNRAKDALVVAPHQDLEKVRLARHDSGNDVPVGRTFPPAVLSVHLGKKQFHSLPASG